ncbi:enoyl-CoA hydratase/isomerase family protein [bacterium]|nr:enoyl-CoA hydratase/isomerase family protein [bacterium]
MSDTIYEEKDNLAVITLNRPDSLNSVKIEQLEELVTRLNEYEQNDKIRAIVITATGRGFCTGADLTGGGGRPDAATAMGMKLSTHIYSRVPFTIASIEKPVIAAVNGIAAGFGCNLALCCDMIYATPDAKFIEIFVKRGMCPDGGGTYFLPRLVGLARAKEIFFSGDPVLAEEALKIGMINKVVPNDKLMDETMEYAKRIAKAPTRSVGMIKRLLNRSFDTDLQTQLEFEAAYQGLATSTSDMMEGVVSFLEKRDSNFQGK